MTLMSFDRAMSTEYESDRLTPSCQAIEEVRYCRRVRKELVATSTERGESMFCRVERKLGEAGALFTERFHMSNGRSPSSEDNFVDPTCILRGSVLVRLS
jgi:hypothetical protein